MINKSAGVRNVFSSAHIERGRGSSSAELILPTEIKSGLSKVEARSPS